MKKTLTILILMFSSLFINSIIAQHQAGVIVGVNLAEVDIDPLGDGAEISPKPGFALGTIININFTPNLGLQIEPTYMQKGASVKISTIEEGYDIKVETTIKASYIDVPILFRATFILGDVNPYIIVGVAPAFLVDDFKEELENFTVDGIDLTNSFTEKEIEIQSNSFDLAANFGAGVSIPLGNIILFLEGQYSLGLLNVNDEEPEPEYDPTKITNKGFQIKAGVTFPLTSNETSDSSPAEAH